MSSTIALFATDTMADWEYAHLTTEVARAEQLRPNRFRLVFVGDGLDPVTTLGGLTITPQVDLAELATMGDLAVLVVPGADTYLEGQERLVDTVTTLTGAGVPVAAICGATFLLARAGLLDDRRHTSNAAEFLEYSGYAGAGRYEDRPVVTDRGVTTGSGIRPVEFSAEVFRVAGLYPDAVIDPWERLYRGGTGQDYAELTEAVGAFAAGGDDGQNA